MELLGHQVDIHSASEETSKEFSKVVASFILSSALDVHSGRLTPSVLLE